MGVNNLKVPFNTPLNEIDTWRQTYSCRATNLDIYFNNYLQDVCVFVSSDEVCKKQLREWEKQYAKLKGGIIRE